MVLEGRWAGMATPKLLAILPFALHFDVDGRKGGGLATLSGNIFGVSDIGGGTIGGRAAGHSTGLGHAIAGTSATDPLGFGPFAIGTGASATDPVGFGPFAIGTGGAAGAAAVSGAGSSSLSMHMLPRAGSAST
jgi:hypothetical protein